MPCRGSILRSFFVQGRNQVQVTGEGFVVDQGAVRQHFEASARDGANVNTYVYETLITPVTAGKLELFAQGFSAGSRFSGSVIVSTPGMVLDNQGAYTLLESEPAELAIEPLPREGQLPGFTGAIASLAVEGPDLSTNVLRVGEPVKLAVTIKAAPGSTLGRIVPPPPPTSKDWQMLPATTDSLPTPFQQEQRAERFFYTFVPLSEKLDATPAIPFSCFDPNTHRYRDLT